MDNTSYGELARLEKMRGKRLQKQIRSAGLNFGYGHSVSLNITEWKRIMDYIKKLEAIAYPNLAAVKPTESPTQ